MTSKICEPESELTIFLADYVKWLWGCGATCTRIEKNVDRIASSYGFSADLTILPHHVTIVIRHTASVKPIQSITTPLHRCAINFDLNSRLSSLSWRIADNNPSLPEAIEMFHKIICHRYSAGWTTVALVSLANASFCRLFGGDALAMGVVFFATLAGYSIKTVLVGMKLDMRLVVFVCAILSSTLCAGATLFNLGLTPDVALATSILYLIPGVPYINAASDMIARHYLCAFYRFTDALILTACLSLGLCVGLGIMNLSLI